MRSHQDTKLVETGHFANCDALQMYGGKPLVLDGGLGIQLETLAERRNFAVKNDPLWSGRALIEAPDLIEDVHKSFLEAGCDIVTTSTYQISRASLKKYTDFTDAQIEELWAKSVDVCWQACKFHESKARVCGAIGPYGGFLANYAEYTGEYGLITNHKLEQYHLPLATFLNNNLKVDILAFETIPNYKELKVIVNLVCKMSATGPLKPFYLSMNFRNSSQMSDGTPIEKIMGYLNGKLNKNRTLRKRLIAIGCNCTELKDATHVLKNIETYNYHNIPTIVYPNVFADHNDTKIDQKWLQLVDEWLKIGASIIGGCCGTGPKQIAQIRFKVDHMIY